MRSRSNSASAAVPYISTNGSSTGSHARSSSRVSTASRRALAEPDAVDARASEVGAFDLADFKACTIGLDHDPIFRLAQTVLSRVPMQVVLEARQVVINDAMVFSDTVDLAGKIITNQKASGRCWLFATTNIVRIFTARKHNLVDFQLSQSYLFFYDHLAKANWFLEQVIDLTLADEPLDSRTFQFLFANTQAQDGGQYDMVVNLIEEYGLVPQSVYPESHNSSFSADLDKLLSSKLREFGLSLRHSIKTGIEEHRLKRTSAERGARELKHEQMKEIYRILTITCGTPPMPNEKFLWEYRDKSDKYHRFITTPLEFARKHAGYDVADCVSLINDPRNTYDEVYTVERLGNVVGGRPVRYINLQISEMKEIAVKLIQDNIPVWFGCDVDRSSNQRSGVMDSRLYDYDDAFGTKICLTKAERLQTGDSQMTHAMVLVAVHLDPLSNRPVRWKVENSWGSESCNRGFFVMSDDWFTENVFQIVAPRSHVHSSLLKLYDHGKAVHFPLYDPLGALA